jgi:heme exporter protein D
MYFENFAALINMDGHGIYVWVSVAVTLATMLWLIVAPLISQRRLLKEVSRDIQRQQDRDLAAQKASNYEESH